MRSELPPAAGFDPDRQSRRNIALAGLAIHQKGKYNVTLLRTLVAQQVRLNDPGSQLCSFQQEPSS